MCDLSEFILWHNEFQSEEDLKLWGEDWYDQVTDKHQELKEKFSGFSEWNYGVKTKKSQSSADSAKFIELAKDFFGLYPSVLNAAYRDGYTLDSIRKPTLLSGTHDVLKTSKYLSRLVDEYYYANKKTALNLISQMGEEWSKFKSEERNLDISIAFMPQAFCNLGHYEVDHDSCFRNGGENDFQKYFIGQSPNTFVLLVEDLDLKKTIARFWGFATENCNRFNICNCYLLPGTHDGTIIEAIKIFFSKVLDGEITVKEDNNLIKPGIFHNRYGNFSFFKETKEKFAILHSNIKSEYVDPHIECPRCDETYKTNEGWELIGKKFYCGYCFKNAPVCYESGQKTIECFPAYNKEGKQVYVSTEFYNRYNFCITCGYRFDKSTTVEHPDRPGKYLCKSDSRTLSRTLKQKVGSVFSSLYS